MNVLRAFKKTRFFLFVNIGGLAIGLAVSIMLILFIVNELGYDKHLENYERIIRLNTVKEENGDKTVYGINLRKAYTELPGKVPGIEAATQIYYAGETEIQYQKERFQDKEVLYVDKGFFDVFHLKFIEGTLRTAFAENNSAVINRSLANGIFGGVDDAVGKHLNIGGTEVLVSAVVENLPLNTHFSFDILVNMETQKWIDNAYGLEFFTYYLIKDNVSFETTCENIVKEYQPMADAWGTFFVGKASGKIEKLSDIYWNSEVSDSFGKSNNISFIWLLSVLSVLILFLAVANFINLFIAQGESRMLEIGIRKSNGARRQDIIRQFFKEVSIIVFISFVLGLCLTILLTPAFATLIKKDIDLIQLLNPWFILSIVFLFVVTVVLSAAYPSFYLSRFSPLDILGKRLKFSKRRLTVSIVVFQSLITIVLISFIWMINKQASYLENMSLGYNPKQVVYLSLSRNLFGSFGAVENELLTQSEIKEISTAQHIFGFGGSGQFIGLYEDEGIKFGINEYRIRAGSAELMGVELIDGEFFKPNLPDSIRQIILNEAAVKELGLRLPVAGKVVNYSGSAAEIVGVVKDFFYLDPAQQITPLALSRVGGGWNLYIRLVDHVTRSKAEEVITKVLHKFDSEYVFNPVWAEDIHAKKFDNLRTQSRVILIASCLSMFIAMLGLVAIHLYTTKRRTKEVGIRRVNGATASDIFSLLSVDIIKWVLIAGLIAIPVTYYVISEWMSNFVNRTSLSWYILVVPILIQGIIAIVVTSGISWKALSQNPIETLKKD